MAVIVAIIMVVLLGFAAIAVDVGMLYSERAQLQNGADAGAMFVAQKCASRLSTNAIDCNATPSTGLRSVVSGNAVDGVTNVDQPLALDTVRRTVTATVRSQEPGKAHNGVSTFFARVLGIPTVEGSASATAQWGTPSKGTMVLPIAIAECKFKPVDPISGKGPLQLLQLDKDPCANKNIPGGFGWIKDDTDAKCAVTIGVGQADNSGTWFSGDTGASAPCVPNDLSKMNDQTVLFPLFDEATGTGASGKYYVKGFAAFHVTAYHLSNGTWGPPGSSSIPNKSIQGYFVRFVSLSQALELGDSPDYGSTIVRLTIGAPTS
ncbi:UNVERIFIED_ORG: hypothetical protein J2X79_001657 [Arthrobacter globiformis]|nr:hypothetical protein [Arthrobacter globiformis]